MRRSNLLWQLEIASHTALAMTRVTKRATLWWRAALVSLDESVGYTRNEIDRRPQASSLLSLALRVRATRIGRNMAAIIIAPEAKVNRRFDQRQLSLNRYPCIAPPSRLW